MSAWSNHDPPAALAYADSIPEPSERSALRMSALCHWLSADPLAASATAASLSPAERGEVAILLSLPCHLTCCARFCKANGISDRVESRICGDIRRRTINTGLAGNTDGAMAALEGLPPDVRSNVATEFAWLTARNHPDVAWRLLDHVNEPIERMELETRLLR